MSKVSHTAEDRVYERCFDSSSAGREDEDEDEDTLASRGRRTQKMSGALSSTTHVPNCETTDIFLLGGRRRVPGRVNGETRNRECIQDYCDQQSVLNLIHYFDSPGEHRLRVDNRRIMRIAV